MKASRFPLYVIAIGFLLGVEHAARADGPMAGVPAATGAVLHAPLQDTVAIGKTRLPGEFEPQEAMLLAAGALSEFSPEVLTSIVRGLSGNVPAVGIVTNAQQRAKVLSALSAGGLPPESIRLIEVPHHSRWMRDYGPIFIDLGDNGRGAIDPIYAQLSRFNEDRVPVTFASLFDATRVPVDLVLEGGNALSNGQGLCLTTRAVIDRNQPDRYIDHQYDEAAIAKLFAYCFGSTQTIVLEPLQGDITRHVDMFATFTAADTVVVGSYHPAEDPINAAILDRNAERLAGLKTAAGPLRVARIPMPLNRDGVFRTYTNVLYANGTLLAPLYPGLDAAGEAEAMATYRRLLPGWKVVGINVTDIIGRGGGLHCLATNVPVGNHRSDREKPPALSRLSSSH